MQQIHLKMRKWLHRALKGASLTTALFVFQACYGTPPGLDYEIPEPENLESVEPERVAPEPAAPLPAAGEEEPGTQQAG